MAIDGLPVLHPLHQRLKEMTDPFFDKTGLWQGEWNLFAPEPIKVTRRTGVEMVHANGSTYLWSSPRWETFTPADRFLGFRSAEFYDAIVLDDNRGAWPCFLDYAVEKYGREVGGSGKIVKANLIRYFRMTALPWQPAPAEQSVVIYTKAYPQ